MKKLNLCGVWAGQCISPDNNFEFAGNIPGSAINDLICAGHLPKDIFWRDNADSVLKFEKCNYIYKRSFDFNGEHHRTILRFERIDTYADVFLNGAKIYHSENGNIRHDIDVSEHILNGDNLLEVHLYSPIESVKDMPLRGGAFSNERMNTRRTQCTYGWDWVARFVTCGLGEVSLLTLDEFEIFDENVYIATLESDSESATVRVDIEFPYEYRGRILDFSIIDPQGKVSCNRSKYCKEDFVRLDFDIPSPLLWYPLGYGEQPLYTFSVKAGGNTVYSQFFGIRTVKIMQLTDAIGSRNHALCLSIKDRDYDFNESFSGFVLKINGQKVFCRGANWVPCTPYGMGNVDARVTEILELCAEAGVNMLRVWGGGAFESNHFYSECSRLGIMVTQDFLMACGSYPEEKDWFIEELRKEARYIARLCRNQPCLMWWSGDNENAVNGCDTDENYRGRRSAYDGIAPILYRDDPYRRFLPSSPYGGKNYASNTVGTTHNTQCFGYFCGCIMNTDLSDYKEALKKYRARFIAEEPQLGAASLPSLRRFMTEEDIFGDDQKMWLYHMKGNPAMNIELFELPLTMARRLLGNFESPDDKLFKLQYVQYEWVRVVMEQARRERDFCSGIIFWMMNDCWPSSAGWALVDYYNLPKNAFYAFKRCAKPIIASIDYEDGKYSAYVINDGNEKIAHVSIKVLSKDRTTLTECASLDIRAGSESSDAVFEKAEHLNDGEVLICEIDGEFGHDRTFYSHGGLKICPSPIDFEIDKENKTLTVTAKAKYIHAVTIMGNAIFKDNCFSLFPHESRTVSYRPIGSDIDEDLTVEAYTLQ